VSSGGRVEETLFLAVLVGVTVGLTDARMRVLITDLLANLFLK